MSTDAISYPHSKHLTIAGCLALVTLGTAVTYASHSTPYTMVLFLGGGSTLLTVAIALFCWTVWKDLRARLDSMVTRRFEPGQLIFHQGDAAEHVFVVTKGQVEAVFSDPAKGDTVVWRVGPGDFFGETAILSGQPRHLAVRAVDAVELLSIHRDDFLRLYSSLPRLRARIQAQQVERKALVSQVKTTEAP
jgi:signal-transduction protein with cAMP-binding, CBS, and nucleotidyltransferase domain